MTSARCMTNDDVVPFLHEAKERVAAHRLGDGFFPATGTQGPTRPLIDLMRRTAEAAGRHPADIELTTGCPGAVGREPLAAVDECRTRGVHRVAVPASAFLPDPEARLAEFGQRVVRQSV